MLYTDTIDHSILFDVLEKRFGPGHDAVKMDDVKYFEGWTQAFQAGNIDSDPHTLRLRIGCCITNFLLLHDRTYRKSWCPSRSNTIYMQTTGSFSTRKHSRTWMPVDSGSRIVESIRESRSSQRLGDFNWIPIRQDWLTPKDGTRTSRDCSC